MTDEELTGEVDLLCAIEYLRSASINAPSEAKGRLEWEISHAEGTLDILREQSESDLAAEEVAADGG